MRSLIIVCIMALMFFSCGEEQRKKSDSERSAVEESLTAEDTKETSGIILFFGNSLTAGMGLEPDEAFPAIIQNKLDSLNLDYKVINAGLSGETTAGGKNRLSWVLKQDIEVFVLELGANDGLRGIPLEETRANLQEIIDFVRRKNPETKIILTGMQIPPNLGQDYTSGFKKIFPELAEKNDIYLIPFLLEDVAGVPELNQKDGIHPTADGQKILADNVWEVLKQAINQ
ncbi:arylesterase [Christiangramia salexigens]|uniref:Arylesterase n=1 Tax=Christiangramia salexigens TaxID=1913577 RepID=A0A1L3J2I4_9FLAO|nr:arylesterase [Christiangramia salexigens]APG59326.1 arylesterase [Christiangramia salexigens]